MNDELHWMGAGALHAAFKAHRLSPVELAEFLLGRIEALDARVNAFCLIDAETTLAQATASEERYRQHAALGPLDGVPVAIKDLLLTKGWPTLRGSRTVDPQQDWSVDAPAVAQLRAAGAVFMGKTTTCEFGHKATCDSPLTGETRNPWNLSLTPGGSSGGAGAALAAGFAPLAFGTDAGGSIRIPASFCGVVGFKPTFGRVAAHPPSPFGTLAHVGPMARSVEDAAHFLAAMSADDPRDPHYQHWDSGETLRRLGDGVKGLRIAWSPKLGFATGLDPQVEAITAKAAKVFESLGAHVEMRDPPIEDPTPFFRPIFYACADYLVSQIPAEKHGVLDPTLQRAAALGAEISRRQHQQHLLQRTAYAAAWRRFMTQFDLVLTPQLAALPFPSGQTSPKKENGDQWTDWSPFSYPFNLTGQPALSVPCGFSREGLPIGLQIVGALRADTRVLAAGHAFEQAARLTARHPEGF